MLLPLARHRRKANVQNSDAMDIRNHFVGMVARRTDKPPAEIMNNTEGAAEE